MPPLSHLHVDDTVFSYYVVYDVDVTVTLECIHLYFLCIVTQFLFWYVIVMYLSHVMPEVLIGSLYNVNKSCQVKVGNPPIV